jgi:hypothetical protein
MEKETFSRRSFFKFALAGATVVPFVSNVMAQKAMAADACPSTAPAGKQVAKVGEGMAKSLNYVEDANTAKHAKYKAGAKCGGCKFYNDKKAEGGYAPCTMMGMKFVTNCGWCSSYMAKA